MAVKLKLTCANPYVSYQQVEEMHMEIMGHIFAFRLVNSISKNRFFKLGNFIC